MVWHDDPDSSRPLLVLTTLLIVWSTLFAGIRLWARWTQQRSVLDITFVASYILAIAQVTSIFLAIARYGFGEVEFDAVEHASPRSWKKSLYAGELLYIFCLGVSKCATSFFLSRLSRERLQVITGLSLAASAMAWMLGSVLAIAIREPTSNPWLTIGPNWTRWLGVEISGLVLEAAMFAFAVSMIIGLQLAIVKRIRIVLIFGSRLLLIPLVAYRLVRLSPAVYNGTTRDIVMVNIFTELVMHYALFAECLTSLRPFMQTFCEGIDMEEATHYWGGLSITTNHHGSNGYLQDSNGKKKGLKVSSREVPDWRRTHDDDTILSRSGFSTNISSSKRGGGTPGGDDDIELIAPQERKGIWVQQETNVEAS